jgi:hypothetical protein
MEKRPFHIIGGAADPQAAAAELSRLRAEIEARNRQETAVAEFGQAALTGVDPAILLGQACAIVELTLGIDHCRALEITHAGSVVVRAALGSNPTFLNCKGDDAENDSIGMYVALAETRWFRRLGHESRPSLTCATTTGSIGMMISGTSGLSACPASRCASARFRVSSCVVANLSVGRCSGSAFEHARFAGPVALCRSSFRST